MKEILKANSRSIFIGFLFYLFIFLGHNSQLISKDSIKTWTAIISGIIFLYLFIYMLITNRESIGVAAIGFFISQTLFSIGIPIFMITNKVFFTTNNELPESLLERDKIELVSNSLECDKIKYGVFFDGIDSIIRYSENNQDYELIKITGFQEKLYRIKWLDSCSYVRIVNEGSVTEYVKIGNIQPESHQMYEKPITTHRIEDERIRTLFVIKTNTNNVQ